MTARDMPAHLTRSISEIERGFHGALARAIGLTWVKLRRGMKGEANSANWHELNEYLLRDIGKTRAEAEFAAVLWPWRNKRIQNAEARRILYL